MAVIPPDFGDFTAITRHETLARARRDDREGLAVRPPRRASRGGCGRRFGLRGTRGAGRRTAAVQVTLPRPLPIMLDGAVVGRGQNLSVRCQPDALTVVV